MNPDILHIETPRTARIVRIAPSPGPAKQLLIGLHGYGQRALDFATILADGVDDGTAVLAPEALSRYYVDHRERRIGASWMTSEDREFEILDQVRYLDAALEEELGRWEAAPARTAEQTGALHMLPPRITVLGFSQGAATASRWIGNEAIRVDRLILWGAPPAHDLTDDEWDALANVEEIVLVAGVEDAIFPKERVDRALNACRTRGCRVRLEYFEGGHVLSGEVLQWVLGPGDDAKTGCL